MNSKGILEEIVQVVEIVEGLLMMKETDFLLIEGAIIGTKVEMEIIVLVITLVIKNSKKKF